MANMLVDSDADSPGFTRVHGHHVDLEMSSDAGTVFRNLSSQPWYPFHPATAAGSSDMTLARVAATP